MTERADSRHIGSLNSLAGAVFLMAFAGMCYVFVWHAWLAQTDGHFTYAHDDPYIHMAIARNLALHGLWGVTPYAPSAASSSPLWVLLLCLAVRLAGDWLYFPLVFGITSSVAAALVLYSRLLRAGIGMPLAVLAVIAVFGAAPLDLLPFTGMEHPLQVLLDLLFVFWFLESLDRNGLTKDVAAAVALTFFICLCRFEDGFLVVIPFFVCLWRRNWCLAVGLAMGPVLAIGGFGFAAHLMGMPWLPNTIVLKANVPPFTPSVVPGVKGSLPLSLSARWFEGLYTNLRFQSFHLSDLFLLCVLSAAAMRFSGMRQSTRNLQVLLWTVCAACLMHAGMARITYYRYEAYLVVLALTAVILSMKAFLTYNGPSESIHVTRLQWIGAVVAFLATQCVFNRLFWFYQSGLNQIVAVYAIGICSMVAMSVGPKTGGRLVRSLVAPALGLAVFFIAESRAVQAYSDLPKSARHVYLQQYQVARFVSRYYPSGRVVAHDIGALTYFTDVHLLDLFGLATDSVRNSMLSGHWNTVAITPLIDGFQPDLVAVYPQWYRREWALPKSLIPVGSWTVPPYNTSVGGDVEMFYAPSTASAARLKTQLMEFQKSLPVAVTVRYGADAVKHVPPAF